MTNRIADDDLRVLAVNYKSPCLPQENAWDHGYMLGLASARAEFLATVNRLFAGPTLSADIEPQPPIANRRPGNERQAFHFNGGSVMGHTTKSVGRAMKKHEACHWLNVIMESERAQRDYLIAMLDKDDWTTTDPETREQRPMTEKEIEQAKKGRGLRVLEYDKKIEALDIAASSLTR